ncbi:type I-A CRISPR-associated protein Cas5a [Thermococcus sp. P6]|uniref:type I-A CRISPR-associated protein Cas5a n=1 Tax=Thermococcus sp. P6 TaxID=122420 RepID=UPI001E630BC7|nr:type I-A CRISPR-associated protein Cas5a [Thermococcus sp. P6]
MIPLTKFFKVTLRPTGIIALRSLPQSKMRMALRYVPPTTLIGAVAYPLLHQKGNRRETIYEGKTFRSAAEEVLNLFTWVTVKTSVKPMLYGSLLKINTLYRGKAQSAVTSFPLGVMYGAFNPEITAVYLLNEEALSGSSYSLKDIERALWGITRLGSRESVVSVEGVESGKAKIGEASIVETSYAFPFRRVEVEGRGTLQSVVEWRSGIGEHSTAKRMAMFYPEGSVKVRGDLRTAEVEGEVLILDS